MTTSTEIAITEFIRLVEANLYVGRVNAAHRYLNHMRAMAAKHPDKVVWSSAVAQVETLIEVAKERRAL